MLTETTADNAGANALNSAAHAGDDSPSGFTYPLQYKDAVIHGEVDDAFLARVVRLGASTKGAKTPPGVWQNTDFTILELSDSLAEHEMGAKAGKCLLQGDVIEGERKAQAMRSCSILMLDLDTGEDLAATLEKIKALGLFGIVWTTHSHLKPQTSIKKDAVIKFIGEKREPDLDDVRRYLIEVKRYRPYILESAVLGSPQHTKEGVQLVIDHAPMPKFRVLFVLEKPFVFADFLDNRTANEEWKAKYVAVSDMLGAFYDRSCVDPSRLMYTPRHGKDATGFEIHVIPGSGLDLDNLPAGSKNKLLAFASTDTVVSAGRKVDEFKTPWLRSWLGKNAKAFLATEFFAAYGEPRKPRAPGHHFKCPNDDEHSNAGDADDNGFYCVDAGDGDYAEGFIAKCMHDSCREKDRAFFLDLVIAEHGLAEGDLSQFVDESRIPEEVKSDYVKEVEAQQAAANDDEDDIYYASPAIYADPDILKAMQKMNGEWAVVTIGNDVRYMREPKKVGKMPKFFGADAFARLLRTKKINYVVSIDASGEKKCKVYSVSKLWDEWPGRRTYIDGVVFEPGGTDEEAYNLWRGYPATANAKPGSWEKMRTHVSADICRGDVLHFKWLMTWCAHIVQFPGEKMPSAVGVRGLKGDGKSIFFDWLRKGMGIHAIKVSQKKHIVGDFNGHQKGVTLMVCEEAFWAGDHAAGNALKDLISSEDMMFEQKGIDAIPISNYVRMAFIGNADWIVPSSDIDERRFLVLQISGDHRGNIPYFLAIVAEMKNGGLEAMWDELSHWCPVKDGGFEEEGWDILRQPPLTEFQQRQNETGREAWDSFFVGFIEDGKLEASSNPDLPEIVLEANQPNDVRVADLKKHFEHRMMKAGGYDARRKITDNQALPDLVRKWLLMKGNSRKIERNGESYRAYPCGSLTDIRAAIIKHKIRLDTGEPDAGDPSDPGDGPESGEPGGVKRGNADRFKAQAAKDAIPTPNFDYVLITHGLTRKPKSRRVYWSHETH